MSDQLSAEKRVLTWWKLLTYCLDVSASVDCGGFDITDRAFGIEINAPVYSVGFDRLRFNVSFDVSIDGHKGNCVGFDFLIADVG